MVGVIAISYLELPDPLKITGQNENIGNFTQPFKFNGSILKTSGLLFGTRTEPIFNPY